MNVETPNPWSPTEIENLKTALNNILSNFIGDSALRQKYFAAEMMPYWCRAFTHKTVSPTFNYEILELNGDNSLKWAFPRYLLARMPFLKESMVSELNAQYMGADQQRLLFRGTGLGNFIKVSGGYLSFGVESDVFESLFGALEYVSDQITLGIGTLMCLRFVEYLYRDVQFDVDRYAYGAFRTQLDQIFTRFGLGSPLIEKRVDNSERRISYSTEIYLDAEQVKLIQNIRTFSGLAPIDLPLANYEEINWKHKGKYSTGLLLIGRTEVGQDTSQKAAENNALEVALNTLKSIGVTRLAVQIYKAYTDIKDLLSDEQIILFNEKNRRSGYDYAIFETTQKTSTTSGSVLQLTAVTYDRENPNAGFNEVRILESEYVEDYNRHTTTAGEREALEQLRRHARQQLLGRYLGITL